MKIGPASTATDVSQRMIRHYEKIGLVPAPPRRDSGYRDYSESDLHRLRFIANARDLGFPIEEIRTLLGLWSDTGRASADVKKLASARADELHRKAAALETMRRALLDLAERCNGDDRPDCPIIETLGLHPHSDRGIRRSGGRSRQTQLATPSACVDRGADRCRPLTQTAANVCEKGLGSGGGT